MLQTQVHVCPTDSSEIILITAGVKAALLGLSKQAQEHISQGPSMDMQWEFTQSQLKPKALLQLGLVQGLGVAWAGSGGMGMSPNQSLKNNFQIVGFL